MINGGLVGFGKKYQVKTHHLLFRLFDTSTHLLIKRKGTLLEFLIKFTKIS